MFRWAAHPFRGRASNRPTILAVDAVAEELVASIDRLASKTSIALIAVAAVLLLGWFLFGAGSIAALTPEEAQQMAAADSSVVLLDVRTPQEFSGDTGHLEGAILIPVQELEERVSELAPYKGKTIIAYCRTGNRSGKAATLLQTQGFKVFNMSGGIVQWNEEHRPVVRDR